MFNLTIKQKLIGLGGLVVVVFAFYAVVYMYGSSIRADVDAELKLDMVMEEAETSARITISKARRHEKDFLLQNDVKYIDKHAATMQELYQHLEIMRNNIQFDEGLKAVNQLVELSHKYEEGFRLMIDAQTKLGLDENSGLLGNLRYAVHNIEDSLEKLDNDKLTVKMLMMRRHEKDYMARGDEKYIGLMAQRKGQFGMILSDSGLPKFVRRDIRANMNSYHNDFNALVRGMREIKLVIADFHETINQTEPAFDRVEKIVHQLREAREQSYEIADQRVLLVFALAIIIGGVIILASVITLGFGISRGLDEAVRICRDVAKGKLGLGITPKSKDEIGQLLLSLKGMDENLMRVVSDVQGSVDNIGSTSRQIAQGNASLSQRTEEQASSLEETASSMEEMTSTVKQNAESAIETRKLADTNREKAVASAEIILRTVRAMDDIDESSKRIGDIIGTIDGIAFQTNLLALNAAVEAARAGEQGRGFAVVASEVRSLAQRSAEAAKEIKALIGDSVAKVKVGTELVGESGQTLEEIIDNTKKMADLVAEIAMASNEQAAGISQVSDAVTLMDSMTQENAALVEDAADASRAMRDQANSLDELIAFFQVSGQERKVVKHESVSVTQQPVIASTTLPSISSDEEWDEYYDNNRVANA